MILASFLGGLILFLYGQSLLETGLQKTSRLRLRSILKLLTKHKITALLLGSIISIGTQSSTVAVLTLVSLVNAGLLQLTQAVGLVLGASLGTTLVVQVISFKVAGFALWIIIIGFLVSRIRTFTGHPKAPVLIALGFMFYGIYLMGSGIALFKETPLGGDFLEGVCVNVVPNLTGAFLLTVLCQSTLLPLAIGITLVREGGLPLVSAIPIILGSHVGAGILPIISSFRSSGKSIARQLALANLGYRLLGSLIFLLLIIPLATLTQWITEVSGGGAFITGRQLANAHTLFTLLTIGIFLPFIMPCTKLLKRLVPEKEPEEKKLLYLGPQLENLPKEIIPAAEKEIQRLTEDVYQVLSRAMSIWEQDSLRNVRRIEQDYESIHTIEDCITRYITRLPRELLTEEEYKKEMQLLGIAGNLEKIGGLVGRSLTDIATRRITQGLSFSIGGLNELLTIHRRILNELQLLKDKQKAEKILTMDKELNSMIQASHNTHIDRMHKGFFETRETRSLHLDAITVLERIHSHIQKIANLHI